MEVKLIVVGGKHPGQAVPVRGPKFMIGRGEDCHLRPQSDRVSRHHCEILIEQGRVAVRDCGSTNGTFVNGEKVESEQELKTGDHLKVGPLEFEVELAVTVGGKKKPKVHNVQEAAARTVETAGADDLDITGWLDDEEEDDDESTAQGISDTRTVSTGKTARHNVGDAAAKTDETSPEEDKEKEEKKEGEEEENVEIKPIGKFGGSKKPIAESSRSAAADMLKQFFGQK